MKVHEMIAELQKCDPDLELTVFGDTEGFSSYTRLGKVNLCTCTHVGAVVGLKKGDLFYLVSEVDD